jgi:hypothetical protein
VELEYEPQQGKGTMNRILLSCAGMLAGLAVLATPRSGDACSICDPDRPRCLEAINSRCSTYAYSKTVTVCETYQTSCAYAYAPGEISADGSIARAAASQPPELLAEQARGCHGLIVDRAYSDARQAQARAGSTQIVL